VPRLAADRPRRISRREREAKRQRQIRIGVGLAAAAVIAILLGFGAYDYVIKPRQVLATVDGTRIRREDYWRYRSLELYNQMAQYSQFAQMVQDPSQQQQYQSLALQAQQEFNDTWGSTDVNDSTLQQMIDNVIYVQSLDEFGITITDEEARQWALNQFAPPEAPLIEPTVTPTFVPQRAEWATATAEAMTQPVETITPVPEGGSPEAAASPIGMASPQASPIVSGSPVASPAGEVAPAATPDFATPLAESTPAVATPAIAASPIAATPIGASPVAATPITNVATPIGSPAASPEASPSPTPTIGPEQALSTAEAGFDAYQNNVLDEVHMSTDDYLRLYARPQLARQKVRDALTANIGQTADQIHAQHILVATEELANQLYQDVTTGGQDFDTVAQQSSTDTSTAGNGGDLGWFPRGVMVAPFEEAAFATAPGQIHPPVQTEFGWHIIRVIETEPNRALTDDQISQLQDSTVNKWLEQRREEVSISSVMAPTPTPVTQQFVPPVDAPAPPAPTEPIIEEPTPAASPVAPGASPVAATPVVSAATPEAAAPIASPVIATPVASPIVEAPAASPVVTEAATPVASPMTEPVAPVEATPEGTPQASPMASPMASPAASPIASPVSSPIMNPLGTPTGP